MKRLLLSAALVTGGVTTAVAADFQPPVRLLADGKAIRVESPGYACPCWADLQGDGKLKLLVGQFNGGKIKVYDHLGAENFGPGQWLKAEGKIAEVPGVW
jgi:hypothetical protein